MRRVGFLVLCAFLVGLMSIPSTNGQQYLNLTVADLTPCGVSVSKASRFFEFGGCPLLVFSG